MTIKKAYTEIAQFLEDNTNKKVSTIMPQLIDMMSGQTQSCVRRAEDGTVEAIFCYYHKEWELVSEVEYGAKASSSTGLNSMCKVGVSHWTKQQRISKKAKEQLLEDVASGEVHSDDLADIMSDIEEARTLIN